MSSKFWTLNDGPQPRLYAIRKRSLLRKVKRHAGLLLCAGMLLVLGLLLTGCAPQPIRPCETQPPVSMPALSEPIPSESYSSQWKRLAEEWRKKLGFTPMTQER